MLRGGKYPFTLRLTKLTSKLTSLSKLTPSNLEMREISYLRPGCSASPAAESTAIYRRAS